MSLLELIAVNWPQPEAVGTLVTTRSGGVSKKPYASLNLAHHVADKSEHVSQNRQLIAEQIKPKGLGYQWQWMEQVHGHQIQAIDSVIETPEIDGMYTSQTGIVCCVLTADCLPILFCNKEGTEVAVAHGGWRGLASGILSNLVNAMKSDNAALMAWLGPAIGPCHFEVGHEVLAQFQGGELGALAEQHFAPQENGKYMADLYGIARSLLAQLGVTQVFGGQFCTYCEEQQFFSYRRENPTGRMLSAIYIKS